MTGTTPTARKKLDPLMNKAIFSRMNLGLDVSKRVLQYPVIAIERCHGAPAILAGEEMLLKLAQSRLY